MDEYPVNRQNYFVGSLLSVRKHPGRMIFHGNLGFMVLIRYSTKQ